MLTRDEAFRICETLLAQARAAGAGDAAVAVGHSTESHARFADNRITTSGAAEDLDITIDVWVDRRRGSVTGNDDTAAGLARLAQDAVRIARVSPVHREYVPTLGRLEYDEERSFAASTAAGSAEARAAALETALDTCRRAKVTGAGFHITTASARAAATANGNRRFFRASEGSFSLTARTADGTGSGYYAGDHFDLSRLDVRRIAEQAVDKAVRSQGPKAIEPGTYPVILEAQAVSDLMSFLVGAFDARSAEEGRSAFAGKDGQTRLGETRFTERLTLYSDPHHPELPAVPATAEGIPATRVALIENGAVRTLTSSRFWARERKREASAGPVNYILESRGPTASVAEMVKTMKRGLLVTRFWYVRQVDPRTIMLTGLTRDGLWLVENGEVRYPVRNLRFNQSVLAMLAPWNVDAAGVPERRSPYMVPPLKLAAFTFTSMSDAI